MLEPLLEPMPVELLLDPVEPEVVVVDPLVEPVVTGWPVELVVESLLVLVSLGSMLDVDDEDVVSESSLSPVDAEVEVEVWLALDSLADALMPVVRGPSPVAPVLGAVSPEVAVLV